MTAYIQQEAHNWRTGSLLVHMIRKNTEAWAGSSWCRSLQQWHHEEAVTNAPENWEGLELALEQRTRRSRSGGVMQGHCNWPRYPWQLRICPCLERGQGKGQELGLLEQTIVKWLGTRNKLSPRVLVTAMGKQKRKNARSFLGVDRLLPSSPGHQNSSWGPRSGPSSGESKAGQFSPAISSPATHTHGTECWRRPSFLASS